ncbi:YczE/YyaS/YitT family protein [Isachenkonia alkalipeptolytica]|uniref:Membrane protein n=1 Tax=Isachenkonia alkalipeptolytica TaxID=2565777 RepID=A0AA43XIL3_9CLOT|nr:membrane protein [Isachenkonia alkalipeptolytica]NBG87422.1 membrane protein [Isachenkonia alkalipeptolytica]
MTKAGKITMKEILIKSPNLFLGFIFFAVGILLTRDAGLGMAPWGVFHVGLSNYFPITMGQATQLMGLLILTVAFFLGQIPGLASIMNMVFIGMFIDILDALVNIPTPENPLVAVAMILIGVFFIGWGTYFYLRVELGAGPRDGLMEGLVRKTRRPVWMIRGVIEGSALFLGFLMGGPVGFGTLLIALTLGFSVEFAFKVGGYHSNTARHLNLKELWGRFQGLDNSVQYQRNP